MTVGVAEGRIGDGVSDDILLTQAAGRGEGAARRRLANRLFDRVRETVGYLAGPDPDADDVVQLAMVEILRSARTFRGEGSLAAWADRITVRTGMRLLKRRDKRQERALPAEETLALERPAGLSPATSGEQHMMQHELHQYLAVLLQKIKPERRAAVVLRTVYGYSIREIAEITGARVHATRERLRVGKKELRQLILRDPVLQDWEALIPS